MTIGVLALQGDFSLHIKMLAKLNVKNILVKKSSDFDFINGLIIPGGESTVLSLLINKFNLYRKIKNFSKNHCIYGSCAGAILLSEKCDDKKIKPLKLINIKSFRNFYGRQVNSFTKKININFLNKPIKVSFIRAPKLKCLSEKINILSIYNDNPVLVREKNILVSSFHSELFSDTSIHKYFINMVNENV